jgi:hypothetical protein
MLKKLLAEMEKLVRLVDYNLTTTTITASDEEKPKKKHRTKATSLDTV